MRSDVAVTQASQLSNGEAAPTSAQPNVNNGAGDGDEYYEALELEEAVREVVDGLDPMVVQPPDIWNEPMAVNQILEQIGVDEAAQPVAPVEPEAPVPGPVNIRDTAGQRNRPVVPSFTSDPGGQSLCASILSLAQADGFKESLVYRKRGP